MTAWQWLATGAEVIALSWSLVIVWPPGCRTGRSRSWPGSPVIGPLDDVVVVAIALRYAARPVPRDVLIEAWPGAPSTIERPLGR